MMTRFKNLRGLLAAVSLLFVAPAMLHAEDAKYGRELEGFDYPYPVKHYEFTSQGVKLNMAYMDVSPDQPNGQTAVLLHGKNFCAASWESVINLLRQNGYRVIAVDQIGFCKSTKPEHYQYTFQQLAHNTRDLLHSLGIKNEILVGHSTGGMLAMRYALTYPDDVKQLVLVSPVGLEDWKAKGVPYPTVDDWYQRELKTTADAVRAYEKTTYYVGQWKPEYEKWVQMYAGLYAGPAKEIVAWNSALIYDMIFTQPVIYELGHLSMPVLLISGDKDNTAIAKNFAPADVQPKLGHYNELAPAAAKMIPHVKLVTFPDLGHASWMQDPERFNAALLQGLKDADIGSK